MDSGMMGGRGEVVDSGTIGGVREWTVGWWEG